MQKKDWVIKLILLLIFNLLNIISLYGCASFYANNYPNNQYTPTSAGSIPIYNNFPPEPYEVIGEIGGDGAALSNWGSIGKRLKEYAAQMGGDAIVITQQGTPYVGTYNTPGQSITTSSAYGSSTGTAQIYGNTIYGQSNGQAYGQSNTIYYPGSSVPMYGKSVRALVIKYKESIEEFSIQPSKKDTTPALDSSQILKKVWKDLADKNLDQVVTNVNKLSDLYSEEAKAMQNSLTEYASGSKDKVLSYWALNDVGTAFLLLGVAYENAGKMTEAIAAYKKVMEEYSFAQCWDDSEQAGWFWKPAKMAKDKLSAMVK